jgi:peroxiredoxin
MNKLLGAVSALLIASGSVGYPTSCVAEETSQGKAAVNQLEPGSKAPPLKLKDSNGNELSLADMKGKLVVLEWINFGCPFVKKHYDSGNMQKLQKTYTGKGVVWLCISSSGPGKQGAMDAAHVNSTLKEKNCAPTAYLFDQTGEVGRAYGAKTTPQMFVVGKQGTIVYAGAIDDHPGVDPAEIPQSKNYVKEALDAALAGKPVATSSTKSYGCSVKYQ